MFEYVQEREDPTRLEPRSMIYIILIGEFDVENLGKLSERGKNQVHELAYSRLVSGVSKIYSSPASEAVETSNILKKEFYCNIDKKDCLGELKLGFSWNDEANMKAKFHLLWEDDEYKPKNGESISEARTRIRNCLNEIGLRHQGDSVAIVTHPLAMSIFHSQVTGTPLDFHDWSLSGFASCAAYEHTRKGWTLVMPPDNSFLSDPSTIADVLPENLMD